MKTTLNDLPSMGTEDAPYIVERCIRTGYRGGKRKDGWYIKRDGKLVEWSQWKSEAKAKADELNRGAR